jgi:hypothetical protein
LRGVFGIDRQKLRQFALEIAQLALVVGQGIIGVRDLASRLVDRDDARALVDERGQLALRRRAAFLEHGLPVEAELLIGRQGVGVLGLELADPGAAGVELAGETLHLLLEEVERTLGAAGPELDIGGDDARDVFVDHVGGDLAGPRLEGNGDDGGLVAPARAGDARTALHQLDDIVGGQFGIILENVELVGDLEQISARQQAFPDNGDLFVRVVVTVTSTRSSEICGDSTKSRASPS